MENAPMCEALHANLLCFIELFFVEIMLQNNIFKLYLMYLIHTVYSSPYELRYRKKHGFVDFTFNDILKSGKLRSSSKTKNIGMFAMFKGSKHIFLRIDQKKDIGNLYLDPSFLLNTSFYLQFGWDDGLPNTKKIDGRKLSKEQLDQLLQQFAKEVKKNIISTFHYLKKKKEKKSQKESSVNDEFVIDDNNVDEEYDKLEKVDIYDRMRISHSNEILVENNIDLKKYLRKIVLTKDIEGYNKKDEIIETVKEMYPNVELKDYKRKRGSDEYVFKDLL
jgi:hypothetical protein